jgi:hypothetical protein
VPEKGATPARANPHAQANTPPTSHGANGGGRRDEQEHPGCWERVCSALDGLRQSVLGFAGKLAKIAREDPRRVAHALQVGLALTLVSVLYYVAPLFRGFGVSTLWAVLTVVVVTEYTVGTYVGPDYWAISTVAGIKLICANVLVILRLADRRRLRILDLFNFYTPDLCVLCMPTTTCADVLNVSIWLCTRIMQNYMQVARWVKG